jgi:hypothetical protein
MNVQEVCMRKMKRTSVKTFRQDHHNEDAVFMGWQEIRSGQPLALYNITAAGHPSLGSTVTDKSLLTMNLQIPQTPVRPAKSFESKPGGIENFAITTGNNKFTAKL